MFMAKLELVKYSGFRYRSQSVLSGKPSLFTHYCVQNRSLNYNQNAC